MAENTCARKIQLSHTPLGPRGPFTEQRRAQCCVLSAEGCLGAARLKQGPELKETGAGRKERGTDNLWGQTRQIQVPALLLVSQMANRGQAP